MQWINISPLQELWVEDCASTSVARKDKIRILQVYILINSKAEVSICIESIGITWQRPLFASCSQSHLKLIISQVLQPIPSKADQGKITGVHHSWRGPPLSYRLPGACMWLTKLCLVAWRGCAELACWATEFLEEEKNRSCLEKDKFKAGESGVISLRETGVEVWDLT